MKKFSISEAIKSGWETFKKNWQFLLAIELIGLLVGIGPQFIRRLSGQFLVGYLIIILVFWIVRVIVDIGTIKIYLSLGKGEKTKLSELFTNYRFFLSYFIGSFITGIFILLGLIFLILPGIYLAIRFSFWPYILIDKQIGVDKAIMGSWGITEKQVTSLIGFKVVQFLVGLVGLLALFVGIFVSGPVNKLAEVFVYRKLSRPL